MKTFLAILCALCCLSLAHAQEPDQPLTRKEKRELKKKEEAKLRKEMAGILAVAIDSQLWVLEANSLANKYGSSVQVSSSINFIAIEKGEAFIQLGSNSGLGPNGVGGVSVRTTINRYEVERNDKKGFYFIHISTHSALGSFDIRIDCSDDGNMASATIQGNSSRRVSYRGRIVPIGQSNVYKGMPLF